MLQWYRELDPALQARVRNKFFEMCIAMAGIGECLVAL